MEMLPWLWDLKKSYLIEHSRGEIETNYALFWERSFASVEMLLWKEGIPS